MLVTPSVSALTDTRLRAFLHPHHSVCVFGCVSVWLWEVILSALGHRAVKFVLLTQEGLISAVHFIHLLLRFPSLWICNSFLETEYTFGVIFMWKLIAGFPVKPGPPCCRYTVPIDIDFSDIAISFIRRRTAIHRFQTRSSLTVLWYASGKRRLDFSWPFLRMNKPVSRAARCSKSLRLVS